MRTWRRCIPRTAKGFPAYDPEGSKKLLAEAGFPDGLQVVLSCQQARAEPMMAQALKESAAAGGFDIKLDLMPSSSYWDKWTELPLGITIWSHRPLDTMVLSLAYTADAEGKPVAWNETAWVDEEFSSRSRRPSRRWMWRSDARSCASWRTSSRSADRSPSRSGPMCSHRAQEGAERGRASGDLRYPARCLDRRIGVMSF